MELRRVEGYQEGNVAYIFPEGQVSRFNLLDSLGRVRTRRLVIGTEIVESKYETLADILVLSGLIPDENYVTIMTLDGDFRIVSIDSDEHKFTLQLVQ